MHRKLRTLFTDTEGRERMLRSEISKEGGVGRGDVFAMLISAYLTVIPAVTVLLLLFVFVAFVYSR